MIIITGGAGFVGSNLVAGLEEKGLGNLVIVDWLGQDDKWRNVCKRELRDIIRPERIFEFLNAHVTEVEAIFHLGAISSTTERDADLVIERNFTFSNELWSWCARHNVRFIYASSAATYGNAREFNDEDTVEALARMRPLNPYGWAKHMFDRRIARIIHSDKEKIREKQPPQWAGLKFFNVYGPNEYHKGDQMSVVCKLFPQASAGAQARLFKSYDPAYPDGGQIRDFVYVRDCVDVMLWLYDNPQVSGLFNVGSGKGRSFKDLAESVFSALGRPPKITYIDMPDQLRGHYQYFTEANVGKLRSRGYDKPFTTLEDGVKDYVRNYLMKDDPYR